MTLARLAVAGEAEADPLVAAASDIPGSPPLMADGPPLAVEEDGGKQFPGMSVEVAALMVARAQRWKRRSAEWRKRAADKRRHSSSELMNSAQNVGHATAALPVISTLTFGFAVTSLLEVLPTLFSHARANNASRLGPAAIAVCLAASAALAVYTTAFSLLEVRNVRICMIDMDRATTVARKEDLARRHSERCAPPRARVAVRGSLVVAALPLLSLRSSSTTSRWRPAPKRGSSATPPAAAARRRRRRRAGAT